MIEFNTWYKTKLVQPEYGDMVVFRIEYQKDVWLQVGRWDGDQFIDDQAGEKWSIVDVTHWQKIKPFN